MKHILVIRMGLLLPALQAGVGWRLQSLETCKIWQINYLCQFKASETHRSVR